MRSYTLFLSLAGLAATASEPSHRALNRVSNKVDDKDAILTSLPSLKKKKKASGLHAVSEKGGSVDREKTDGLEEYDFSSLVETEAFSLVHGVRGVCIMMILITSAVVNWEHDNKSSN